MQAAEQRAGQTHSFTATHLHPPSLSFFFFLFQFCFPTGYELSAAKFEPTIFGFRQNWEVTKGVYGMALIFGSPLIFEKHYHANEDRTPEASPRRRLSSPQFPPSASASASAAAGHQLNQKLFDALSKVQSAGGAQPLPATTPVSAAVYAPTAICIVSRVPFLGTMRQILTALFQRFILPFPTHLPPLPSPQSQPQASRSHSSYSTARFSVFDETGLTLEQYLHYICEDIPLPTPGVSRVIFPFPSPLPHSSAAHFTLSLPTATELPMADCSLLALFQVLDLSTVLTVLGCLLTGQLHRHRTAAPQAAVWVARMC
jgi:hypothetical protein